MRVFVFEFICCGGLLGQKLPAELQGPGKAMLAAVIEDLAAQGAHVVTMWDPQVTGHRPPARVTELAGDSNVHAVFDRLAAESDATLIIAPELEGCHNAWAQRVESRNLRLLGSSSDVIAACSDKLAMFETLQNAGITTPATRLLRDTQTLELPSIVKPRFGAGCQRTGLFQAGQTLSASSFDVPMLVQRYVQGTHCSAAFITGPGLVRPLRAGLQKISFDERTGELRYAGGRQPLDATLESRALAAAERAVRLLAAGLGLRGFVGVDLVLTDGADGNEPSEWIIEINPRVTMAYVGLRRLAALNMGALLLDPKAPMAWREGPVEFSSSGLVGDECSGDKARVVESRHESSESQAVAVLGLDIGGANIKAANAQGWATSVPFALWREPERLGEQLKHVLASSPRYTHVAVTMTGELCDCFHTKRDGVREIVNAVMKSALRCDPQFWSTAGKFVPADVARGEPLKVAASNWHALATIVGRQFPRGLSLLVDIGSTTTDLIPIRDGQNIAQGRTDTQRLMHGELLYTGAMRTPVMALGTSVLFEGRRVALMAERFATAHDVHVLTGELPEDPNDTDTADGRPVTLALCAARLVRMIGADLEMISYERAVTLATALAAMQRDLIVRSARLAMSGRQPDRVIVSGSGAFLASDVCPDVKRVNLSEKLGPAISSSACAYAVATLLQTKLRGHDTEHKMSKSVAKPAGGA